MRRTTVRSLLVATALGVTAPFIGACVVETRGAVVVDSPPPPPRSRAVVHARQGFVWVDGFWTHMNGKWVWREGYWERDRMGYVYVQGRWMNRGGRWHWVEPRWERGHARARGRVRGNVRQGPR